MDVFAIYGLMLRALFPSSAWLASWVWFLLGLSVAEFAAAFALAHVVSRRRFYRRNFAGVETFSSYGHKVITDVKETGIALLATLLMSASLMSAGAALVGFVYR